MDAFWSDRIAMHRAAPPFAVIDGIAVHGDGWAPDVGWGLFGDVAIAHPDFRSDLRRQLNQIRHYVG